MPSKYEIEQFDDFSSKSQVFSSTHMADIELSSTQETNKSYELIKSTNTQKLNKRRRKYGNMKVLFQNDRFLLTLGPDYICFIIAYILFTLMQLTISYLVYISFQNIIVQLLNMVACLTQNLSYISIALSNPGIQTDETLPTEEDMPAEQIKRFCKKCSIRMQTGTYHCRQCDACVRQYDHHCPWTSKCIGQNNLCKFHFFIGATMTFLLYSVIMVIACLAMNANEHNQNLKNKKF